jgi:hypothetical protein
MRLLDTFIQSCLRVARSRNAARGSARRSIADLQQQRARRGEFHRQQQARRGNGARDVTVKPKLQGNRKFRNSTQRRFLRTIDLWFAHEGCFLLPRGNHTKDGSFLPPFLCLHYNHFHLVKLLLRAFPLTKFFRPVVINNTFTGLKTVSSLWPAKF